jgi:hypothetical protein
LIRPSVETHALDRDVSGAIHVRLILDVGRCVARYRFLVRLDVSVRLSDRVPLDGPIVVRFGVGRRTRVACLRRVDAVLTRRPFENRKIVGARPDERRHQGNEESADFHSEPRTPTKLGPTTTAACPLAGAFEGALKTKSTAPAPAPTKPATSPTFAIVSRDLPVEIWSALSGGQGPP